MFGRITPVVKTLLLINIGILVIQSFLALPLVELFGLRYIFAEQFVPYQFFTYMFVHSGFWHLLGNMFALFIFGPMLEHYMGANRLLLFYTICGLGAGALYSGVNFYEIQQVEQAYESFTRDPSPEKFLNFIEDNARGRLTAEGYEFVHETFPANPDNQVYIQQAAEDMRRIYEQQKNLPMVGASGAVFGILMAFGLLFPNLELMLLFPPIPIKAKYLVLFYGGFEVYSLINQRPDDNVAHLAHLGGMLFAFVLIKWWGIKGPYN